MKVKTYLPVFSGFYNTIFEPCENAEIDDINNNRTSKELGPITYDDCKFDYDGYFKEVAEQCCDIIEYELGKYVSKITLEELISPKEYNFHNDSINCEIELTEKNIKAINKTIFDNLDLFEDYLQRYKSCDGFISFYSEYASDWLNDKTIKAEVLKHEHKLGSILEFICQILEIDDMTLYENLEVYIYATNYDELCGNYDELCGS